MSLTVIYFCIFTNIVHIAVVVSKPFSSQFICLMSPFQGNVACCFKAILP